MGTNGQVAALLLLTCIAETLSRKIRRLMQKHALLSLACASGGKLTAHSSPLIAHSSPLKAYISWKNGKNNVIFLGKTAETSYFCSKECFLHKANNKNKCFLHKADWRDICFPHKPKDRWIHCLKSRMRCHAETSYLFG